MLRINKLADYGFMLMASLVKEQRALNARELAQITHLALPTVSKILKALTKAGLLKSLRGAQGGYRLACDAETITLATLLEALEENMAIVDCAHGGLACNVEHFCRVRHNWQLINRSFQKILSEISLADMLKPAQDLQKKLIKE